MRYLILVSLVAIVVVAAGCSGSSTPPTYTLPPTYTPYPTYTPAIVTGAIWLCRHVVQPGDTVEALAAYYNTTTGSIMQENNLRTVDDLIIGDVIHIPVGSMGCPPTPTPSKTYVPPSPSPTLAAARPTTGPTLQQQDCFPWDTANTFMGQTVCIGGWVVSAEEVAGSVYLYFGTPPENNFRVVIPADARGSFPGNPIQTYGGHHILVRGLVESQSNAPLIRLRSTANVRVLE